MKLIDRLIFGTARLSGGAYAPANRKLLEDCLKAGLTRFDTAPSYGMGAAESLLGDVTAGMADAELHTKVGSPRPSHPALRGWAKRLRNIAPRGPGPGPSMPHPYAGPPAHYDYSPSGISQSLEASLSRLRRSHVALLLTHEAEPGDLPPESWAVLEQAQANGRCAKIGFATSGPIRQERSGVIAQIAPQAADFLAGAEAPRIFHSVRNVAVCLAAADPQIAAAIDAEKLRLAIGGEGALADYLSAASLLLASWPNASIIVATTDRGRLAQMLGLAAAIDCVTA